LLQQTPSPVEPVANVDEAIVDFEVYDVAPFARRAGAELITCSARFRKFRRRHEAYFKLLQRSPSARS
jgi:hypothetical protein